MKETKKDLRNRWLHLRLSEREYQVLNEHWKKTTSRERSDYARRVLLRRPVIVNHRNQSLDEVLAEMIRLKNELQAAGNNIKESVAKLHTLDDVSDVKIWILFNGHLLSSLLRKTEEIQVRLNEIYRLWSLK